MPTFNELLVGKPVYTQATARAVQAFIRSLGASEHITRDTASYQRNRIFCTLQVKGTIVRLVFPAELELSDPARLLQNTDTQRRSLLIAAPTDFSDQVRGLIRAAYQQA